MRRSRNEDSHTSNSLHQRNWKYEHKEQPSLAHGEWRQWKRSRSSSRRSRSKSRKRVNRGSGSHKSFPKNRRQQRSRSSSVSSEHSRSTFYSSSSRATGSSSYCSTCSSSGYSDDSYSASSRSNSPSSTTCSSCSKYYSRSPKRKGQVEASRYSIRPSKSFGRLVAPSEFYKTFVNCSEFKRLSVKSQERTTNTSAIDPRLGKPFLNSQTLLNPVFFAVDEYWVYHDLPEYLLIREVSCATKAQLLGQFEGQVSNTLSKLILDIEIYQNIASIKFLDGTSAYTTYIFMRDMYTRRCLTWYFELDMRAHKFENLKNSLMGNNSVSAKRPSIMNQNNRSKREEYNARKEKQNFVSKEFGKNRRLSCSSRVACLLVDYDFFPARHSSRELSDIFKDYPLHSIERDKDCWHIHIMNQASVERAFSNRYNFEFEGRRIRPYLLNSSMGKGQDVKSNHKKPTYVGAKKPSEQAPNNIIDDTLENLRNRILGSTIKIKDAHEIRFFEPLAPSSALECENLLNIPIFNKKYLEKLQAMGNDEEDEEGEEIIHKNAAQVASLEQVPPSNYKYQEIISPKPLEEQQFLERTNQKEDLNVMEMLELGSRSEPVSVKLTGLPILSEGCCRLQGYFKQEFENKHVWYEPIQFTTKISNSGSRTNRRLDANIAELAGKSLSSLHLRQKNLILNRSSIHSYGLFAGEDIDPGELVIEYVGEIIRHSVANERERRYELALMATGSTDIASSYFFRLDLTHVVDASKKGNLARFINHACDPNCTAKVVLVEGRQHIVFYARRPIRVGEEITYDYKFSIEDDVSKKIKCLCRSTVCRKYLN